MPVVRNKNASSLNQSNNNPGAFARTQNVESGLNLSAQRTEVDQMVLEAIGDRLRVYGAAETYKWQDRQFKDGKPDDEEHYPQKLRDYRAKVKNFETLNPAEQLALTQEHKPELAQFLKPGQKFGNDKVTISDDFDPQPGDVLEGLAAQQLVTDSGIRGKIVFTALESGSSQFKITNSSGSAELSIHGPSAIFIGELEDGDYRDDALLWAVRSKVRSSYGADDPQGLHEAYTRFQEEAAVNNAFANSKLENAHSYLSVEDADEQLVNVEDAGTKICIKASEDEPQIFSDRGDQLHPAMIPGFLNHLAAKSGLENGDVWYKELRQVFKQASYDLA